MHTRPSDVPEQRHDDHGDHTRRFTAIPVPASDDSPEPPPDGQTQLVIRRGPDAGSRIVIAKDRTTLGRHRDCDIVLDDVTISRRHAELHREQGRYVIADNGSLNGIYVNRQLIERGELADGDELWIGKFHFTFHTGSP